MDAFYAGTGTATTSDLETSSTTGCSYLAVANGRYVTISAPQRGSSLDWSVTGIDSAGRWGADQAARFAPSARLLTNGRIADDGPSTPRHDDVAARRGPPTALSGLSAHSAAHGSMSAALEPGDCVPRQMRMLLRAPVLVVVVASVGLAACGRSSPHAPSATTALTTPALATFFTSPQGAGFASMFGPNAGTRDCRFVPGGPPGQREMGGRCRTTVRDNGDGTETVTLNQDWDGGQHVWVFRLTASGTVSAVSSSGDTPPQLRR